MPSTLSQRLAVLLALIVVILATRSGHFAALPDASWAVFFIGGFYLLGASRWAFPALIATAVATDWWVIGASAQDFWSHYCLSPAYAFLLLAYGSLWAGGWLLASLRRGYGLRELGLMAVILPSAASLCFLISNGSFYWLSPVVTEPTWNGWLANLGHWYLSYLGSTAIHVAIAATLHLLATALVRALGSAGEHSRHA